MGGDVDVPPFAGVGVVVRGRRCGSGVAEFVEAWARGCSAVKDGVTDVVLIRVNMVVGC